MLLNKNRYVMKSADDLGKASIPANKFVLQANYADSSGVHNGGLQRLIQKTWFNARIDGEYKLRTLP
jgi:phosphoglucomutase